MPSFFQVLSVWAEIWFHSRKNQSRSQMLREVESETVSMFGSSTLVEPANQLLILARIIPRIVASVAFRIVAWPCLKQKSPRFIKDVVITGVRAGGNLSIPQIRAAYVSTTTIYKICARNLGFRQKIVNLPSNARALWIANSNSKNTLVYFHGGGFTHSIFSVQIFYLHWLQQKLISSENVDLSIIILAYSLAPESPYPAQLRQAVSLFQYLLNDEGLDPRKTFLAGDSAGANLALSFLSHVAHPNPDVPAFKLESPLRGVMLISPWVSYRSPSLEPARTQNEATDMLTQKILEISTQAYLKSSKNLIQNSQLEGWNGNQWSEPLSADSEWWTAVSEVVDEVLIWGGGGEILLDSILELSQKISKGFAASSSPLSFSTDKNSGSPRVITEITPKASHSEMLTDGRLPFFPSQRTSYIPYDWLVQRIGS